MRKAIIFVFSALISISVFSQQEIKTPYPYDDVKLRELVGADSNLYVKYLIYEEDFKHFMQQPSSRTDTLINGKRIIPVVFHVIHLGGPENISDAQIHDAIQLINLDYSLSNSDTADTYSLFKSRAADCQIEFRLAKVDPYGNCTDGINRVYDPETNFAYFSTMSKYAWTPSKYMNVFCVNFIYPEGMSLPDGALIGGMSPFPPSNPLTQALTGGDTLVDGILIRHDGIGSIGTATNFGGMPINALNRTFTHESGHYFNLYHPFQNLMFGMIPAGSGCPSAMAPNGDEVDDTPPVDVASQNTGINCFTPGSRNTCNQDVPDEPDMVENYMDYQWGYCTNIFTQGQYQRMEATLMSDRRKLWSYENLVYTGVLDTNTSLCAPIADFYTTTNYVCAGTDVDFGDYSFNGAVQDWQWTFPGGNPATSTQQHPTVNYANPGIYEVSLKVSNASGSDSIVKTEYIHVLDNSIAEFTPFNEDFESLVFANSDWEVVRNDKDTAWSIHQSVGNNSSKSLYLANHSNNQSGSYDEFISPAFDITTIYQGSPPRLKFDLAYAGKINPGTIVTPADTAYDKLNIYVSLDCGKNWIQKYSKSGDNLATATAEENEFTPTATDWRSEIIVLNSYTSATHLMFKFSFYSNGGNNIFIDNFNIHTISSVDDDIEKIYALNIFPNPTNNQSTISFSLENTANINIQVFDISGRLIEYIYQGEMAAGEKELQTAAYSPGIYFIKLQINNEVIQKKLVVQ
jgi:PKD repeat protein